MINVNNAKFGDNSGQIVVGSDNNLQFFKYEITPHGGVVNILPPEQAPRITARPAPIRLRPRAFSKLLGREKEIEQSVTALKASQTIEFYGSTGIGKSVLLQQLAYHETAESLQHFPDGVIYFHLLREEPVEDLQQKLFEAFYDSDRPFKPSAVRVRHDLQKKRALILLDNAKLSRRDIERLGEIAPNCVFAFTSSERSLWGEGKPIQVGGLSSAAALLLIEGELGRTLPLQSRKIAESLCVALQGHPLEILQQIASVREETESLTDVVCRVESTHSEKARTGQLLNLLKKEQHSVLLALAAMGGIGLSARQTGAIAAVQNVDSVLRDLQAKHLVQTEDSRYSLSPNLLESIQQQESLTPYLERAIPLFIAWSKQAMPEEWQSETESVLYLLQWAVRQGRWDAVLSLGKPFESALALLGQWEHQAQVLRWYEQAAESLGNKAATAWASHQLGIRALCLSYNTAAQNLLNRAFRLRQELGDLRGAELTQRCLNFKLPPVAPIPAPPVPIPPQPSPWTDLLKKALVPTLVTTGLVGSGVFLASGPTPKPSPSPTSSEISSGRPSPEPDPSESAMPTPSPTATNDPSISKCVAADVESALNIRAEPNSSTKEIGKLSPKEEAITTGKRQGEFIEINSPMQGWIYEGKEKYAIPCDGTFVRTAKQNPLPSPSTSISSLDTSQVKTQTYKGPWLSNVANGLQLIVDQVEKTDGVVKIYVRAKNNTSGDLRLSYFFNGFYAFDNLGNPYNVGGDRWSEIIPASGTTRGYIMLNPAINPDASSITVTFGNTGQGPGDPGGGKLSVEGIQVK